MYQSLIDALKVARVAQATGMRGETYTAYELPGGTYELACVAKHAYYHHPKRLYQCVEALSGFMPTFHALEQTRKV